MKKKLLPMQKSHLIFFAIGFLLFLSSLFIGIHFFNSTELSNYTYKTLKSFGKTLGTTAEIGFFLVLGLFILRFLIKNLNQKGVTFLNKLFSKFKFQIPNEVSNSILNSNLFKKIRSLLLSISKIFQRYHIIIALVAGSIILIHGSIFLYLGFKWNLGYIFGVLAIINLFILLISGIFRIFNKNIIPHKHLGISFIVLMCLHIIFI